MRAIARAALSDGESIRDEDAAGGVAVGGREAGAMADFGEGERDNVGKESIMPNRFPLFALPPPCDRGGET
jgi:hypothetical protein